MIVCRFLVQASLWVVSCASSREIDAKEINDLREATLEMLNHAYQGYETRAYPRDELMPITCQVTTIGSYRNDHFLIQGRDTWGGYKLTLIDSMDTLLITGDLLQFRRLEEIVRQMSFDIDKNVSVFETNIRIVGGLISSHLLYRKVRVLILNIRQLFSFSGRDALT